MVWVGRNGVKELVELNGVETSELHEWQGMDGVGLGRAGRVRLEREGPGGTGLWGEVGQGTLGRRQASDGAAAARSNITTGESWAGWVRAEQSWAGRVS